MVKRLIDADLLEFCLEIKLISYNKRETEYVDGLFCGLLLAKQIVAEQKPVNTVIVSGGKTLFKDGTGEGHLAFRCPECGGWIGCETYGQNLVWECANCGFRPYGQKEGE